jgi:hypothetical protein
MHGNLPEGGNESRNANDRMDSGRSVDVQTDDETDLWFSEVAQHVLGKNVGLQLAFMAGLEPSAARSCDRYGAGTRAVPTAILRALIHREDGYVWLSAFMADCQAQWWLDLQRARKIAEAIDKIE